MTEFYPDLTISFDVCKRCGAKWLNGQLYWATGNPGKEEDLAGLVCNTVNDPVCINKMKGNETGDTWAKRAAFLELSTRFLYEEK